MARGLRQRDRQRRDDLLLRPRRPALRDPRRRRDRRRVRDLGTGKSASRDTNGLFATDETFEPNHRGIATSHSVWFKWTPSQSGGARFKADCKYGASDGYGTDDAIVAVYTGSLLSSLTQVAYTDTDWPSDCTREYVQFYASAGVTYRIAVDAGPGAIGDTPVWLSQDTTVPTASGGTLKLGAKAKKALKKVKRGTSLTLVAQGPGVVQRSRIRITG